MIENRNEIIYIHHNEVNNMAEYNLLHDINNPHKFTKNINIHYSHILHGCMNTGKGVSKLRTSKFYWIVDVFPRL